MEEEKGCGKEGMSGEGELLICGGGIHAPLWELVLPRVISGDS